MKTILFPSQELKKENEKRKGGGGREGSPPLLGKKPENGSCLHTTGCTYWWCFIFRFWELSYPLFTVARGVSRHKMQSMARRSAWSSSVSGDGAQLQNAERLSREHLLAKQPRDEGQAQNKGRGLVMVDCHCSSFKD